MAPAPDSPAHQIIERLRATLSEGDPKTAIYLDALQQEIHKAEEQHEQARQMLAQHEEAYAKLTSPANRLGVFLQHLEEDRILVALGDTDFVALYDPAVDREQLVVGARVLMNEAYAVVGVLPPSGNGAVIKVAEALQDGRLRVTSDPQGNQGRLVVRAQEILESPIQAGDEVRLDGTSRVAVEHFAQAEVKDYFVEEVPETPWEKIGGQQEAIGLIRETIEHPLLYPELYEKFDKRPIKGVLLYGPPGCGKTLIGKAIAYNLAREYSERKGSEVKEYFMQISGPKILNMWLGETERMVREIFDTARRRAKDGYLVVIFIDEAESILRTRSSGRWLNISNTVVPQFCAEMDGLVALENVVLILTSNRPDYIDPAILRPERIDRKVKIRRPDRSSTTEILSIYLTPNLPIDPELLAEWQGEVDCARKVLIESGVEHLWRKSKDTEFLKVARRDGSTETLYFKDLLSGALIKSAVDRAKDTAIRRAIAEPGVDHGLRISDITEAIDAEFRENEIFPKSDVMEDWLKLIDIEPEQVAAVKPVKTTRGEEWARKAII